MSDQKLRCDMVVTERAHSPKGLESGISSTDEVNALENPYPTDMSKLVRIKYSRLNRRWMYDVGRKHRASLAAR